MLDISVIILTGNEEIHIKRCLDRISSIVKDVFVIDCFSTDKTLDIVRVYNNVTVLQNKWINHATQFNWALNNATIKTEWILRLDADEYLTPELIQELEDKLSKEPEDVTGIVFPLRRVFMGKVIKKGMPQIKQIRLFRIGKAKSEVRQMDECIELLDGRSVEYVHEWVDDNLNNLSWWIKKHVGYAIREAVDLLDIEFDLTGAGTADNNRKLIEQAKSKRLKKHKYAKQPLFWRSFAYFCYRYFFRLGFLEGKEGFMWHFFQGWWYRSLVDAKVWEIKKACGNDKNEIKNKLREEYGIDLHALKENNEEANC